MKRKLTDVPGIDGVTTEPASVPTSGSDRLGVEQEARQVMARYPERLQLFVKVGGTVGRDRIGGLLA